MNAPSPNLKPHVPPTPPGSEACGCCDGIAAETPQGLFNRGGLSAIAYRIGDYAQFRASLHASLSSSRFAPLAQLRTRADDDFTIGLIDAFACAADVLTFYQERIANESYLRTAVERLSLQEMGKLIGYRLRPGVAAETWLAFTLETPPAPPSNLAPEPGSFVTGVPAKLALDAGLKVQSVPGPGEKPQTFETVEPLADARPAWNAMRPWLAEIRKPGSGDTGAYFAGVRNNLKPGDALVILGDEYIARTDLNKWNFRFVNTVELQSDADRTYVTWTSGLDAIAPFTDPAVQNPKVHVLRKRAAAFGHNAPGWTSMSLDFRRNYAGTPARDSPPSEWPGYTLSPLGKTTNGGYLDLDTVYSEVRDGGYVVLSAIVRSEVIFESFGGGAATARLVIANHAEVYKVEDVTEASRAEFALSGKITRLLLDGVNYTQYQNLVRGTAAYVQSEPLVLAPYPVDTPVSGDEVPVAASADGLLPGRRLIVRGTRVSDKAAVVLAVKLVSADRVDAARCTLKIDPPLPDDLVRASVVVHANVTLASHGETVSQILGAGDASQAFQRFELKQLPLTYRAAVNEIGAAAQLTVRVGDIAWSERPSMYGAAPTERAYVLSTDEQGRDFTVFGDGVRGARLPSGVNNVRATYRKGLGAGGNVAADKLTQLMTPMLGLKGVSNPLAAEGGTDPEPADAARRSIPLNTRTLGRAVSVLDYEDFARAFSGIAKAQAQVLHLAAGPTVVITLAAPNGATLTPASPVWTNLYGALTANGDPHVAVRLLAHQASTFRVGLKVKRNPDYEAKAVLAAVEAALRAHFAFDARDLGQPVQQSDVIAVAQAVPGVTAVDITRLYGGTQPFAQTQASKQVRLLASRPRVQNGVALAAELLTLDPAPFDELDEMT